MITIFGITPEAIKLAPAIQKIKEQKSIGSYCLFNVQHMEMIKQYTVLSPFGDGKALERIVKNIKRI